MSPYQTGWRRAAAKILDPLPRMGRCFSRPDHAFRLGPHQAASPTGRIVALDVARGLSISLVVFGHTPLPAALNEPLSAVRLPLLFMISGCLVRTAQDAADLRRWVIRRAWRLLVPYASAGLLTYLLWLVAYVFQIWTGRTSAMLEVPWYRPFFGLILGSSSADWLAFNLPLWFLPTSFCAQMIFALWLRLTATRSVPTQLLAVLAIGGLGAAVGQRVALPWGLDIAMVVQPFLWMGYNLRQWRLVDGRRKLPAALWLCGAAAYGMALWQNDPVFLNVRAYGHLPWLYAGGIGGGLALLRLAQLLSSHAWLGRALAYLGRHSIVLLNFHVGLAFPVLAILCYLLVGNTMVTAWFLYGLWGILFCAGLAWVVQRHPWLRKWLAGQPSSFSMGGPRPPHRPLPADGRTRPLARAAPPGTEHRPAAD